MNQPPTQASARIYFENLNSIRFIAAFLVIIHHVEQIKAEFQLPNHWDNPVVGVIGKLGVVLFFVLSGFLISYLLFKEQEVAQTISIKDFYIRRVLRIWPLYFMIIALAFFVLPFIPFFTWPGYTQSLIWQHLGAKLALYTLFLPNLAINLLGLVPYASITWSIGAEEQFYLVWPWLNRVVSNKWALMLSVIVGYLLIKFGMYRILPHGRVLEVFSGFWKDTPIDCMAIGGLFAVLLNEATGFAQQLKRIVFSKPMQWATLFLTIALISTGKQFHYFHYEIYAVLFGILIFNFAANPERLFSMEYNWISYLGKVSYGMYILHPIVIVFSIRLLGKIGAPHSFLLYPLVFLLTIGLAVLSYTYFEYPFILLKGKYAKVLSGDLAKART
jgi:peptidoglycan/LPS O-acetylase OafA/YrhL